MNILNQLIPYNISVHNKLIARPITRTEPLRTDITPWDVDDVGVAAAEQFVDVIPLLAAVVLAGSHVKAFACSSDVVTSLYVPCIDRKPSESLTLMSEYGVQASITDPRAKLTITASQGISMRGTEQRSCFCFVYAWPASLPKQSVDTHNANYRIEYHLVLVGIFFVLR